jgi:hypothetical protein
MPDQGTPKKQFGPLDCLESIGVAKGLEVAYIKDRTRRSFAL